MTNPKIEFIKSLYCDAKAVSRDTGMSWELILAQAAQETGWGEKVLAGTHNIFNIKASGAWSGESKTFHVWEIVGGKKVWVDAPFRVYPDYGAALRDRVEFLKQNPRYTKAGLFDTGTVGTLKGEAAALQKAGYATDPDYSENLEAVFTGRTMRAAIKEAEEAGCDCCKGASIVRLTDATRTPLANTKVKLKTPAKEVVVTTSEAGEVGIKPPESPFELAIEVWSDLLQSWFPSDKKILISKTAQAHTFISPHIGFRAKTVPHVPPSSSPPQRAISSTVVSNGSEYSIRRGDTLGGIAKANGVSYRTLAAFNHIQPPYRIAAGAKLRIPGKADLKGKPSKASTAETHVVPNRTLSGIPTSDVANSMRAPWLTFAEHERELKVRRNGGAESDEHIRAYALETSMGKTNDLSYAYCSAFANWCLARAGYKGSHNAMAASFKNWGRSTKGGKPAFGAIAVIKFPAGGHHVTFIVGKKSGGRLITLGGNQGGDHAVSKSSVPASWVVALRLPSDYPDRDEDYELSSQVENVSGMSYASTH
jgi:uncharacterized protein (TIGR02594 family)